jgi:porphobilinogen deaminase
LVAQLRVRSVRRDKVLKAQQKDVKVSKIRGKVKSRIKTSIQILEDEMIVFRRQMYLLENKALKNEIL